VEVIFELRDDGHDPVAGVAGQLAFLQSSRRVHAQADLA